MGPSVLCHSPSRVSGLGTGKASPGSLRAGVKTKCVAPLWAGRHLPPWRAVLAIPAMAQRGVREVKLPSGGCRMSQTWWEAGVGRAGHSWPVPGLSGPGVSGPQRWAGEHLAGPALVRLAREPREKLWLPRPSRGCFPSGSAWVRGFLRGLEQAQRVALVKEGTDMLPWGEAPCWGLRGAFHLCCPLDSTTALCGSAVPLPSLQSGKLRHRTVQWLALDPITREC